MTENVFQAIPGDPNCPIQPGSSCDYCSNGIRYEFWLESANGKRFKVGCECVKKACKGHADRGVLTKVQKDMRTVTKEAKATRDAARIEKAKITLEAVRETLAVKNHPAIPGKSLADYVDFMFAKAGTAGQIRAARIIEKAV